MKTTREINGNKSLLNLPLHKYLGVAVRLVLAGFCTVLYGGCFLAWLAGVWLGWNLACAVVRFLWGCLFFLLYLLLLIMLLTWILTL